MAFQYISSGICRLFSGIFFFVSSGSEWGVGAQLGCSVHPENRGSWVLHSALCGQLIFSLQYFLPAAH